MAALRILGKHVLLDPRLSCTTACIRLASNKPIDYSNFPESYIKREKEVIEWKNPKGPQYNKGKVLKNKVYNYTLQRPWETEAKQANPLDTMSKISKTIVEPIPEHAWCYYKGDRVEVLIGKDKGKHGIINYIVPERNWVIVEGLHCEYKYVGKTADFPGTMIKSEMPLVIGEEVSLVDPSDKKPTTTEWRYTEQGELVRVSIRTGRIIPMPALASETYDYKSKATYVEKPKDTKTADLEAITFTPSVKTFEMDIMDQMGIKEDRIPSKSYWY